MNDNDATRAQPRSSYPAGVPCWIDLYSPDPAASVAFYGGLFGWEAKDALPPEAPGQYFIATLDGQVVAAIGGPLADGDAPAVWSTYIAVDDVDASAALVTEAGGTIVEDAVDVGPAGRMARCADPAGQEFCLWQAAVRSGAEAVNAPGSWNWSNLATADPAAVEAFYTRVFGWEPQPIELGGSTSVMLRLPGYGDHLATLDPSLRERHDADGVPDGFTDAVAWLEPAGTDQPGGWEVTFAVDDTDAAARRVKDLGGTVLVEPYDAGPARIALAADPDGARFTLSHYRP